MGYTHYWHQVRNISKADWSEIKDHIADILKDVQHVQGVPLANWEGNAKTCPEITADEISFNGLGDDSHETFVIHRKRLPKEEWQRRRGFGFCKTARKPYDIAVAACLSYMATIVGSHEVTSDGNGSDWLEGLDLARRALPRFANQIDIPLQILEDDRWTGPWMHMKTEAYHFGFCVDGKAYITRSRDNASYCFPTHREAAEWAIGHKSVLDATGMFDEVRNARLKRQQDRLLSTMVEAASVVGRDQQIPAFVRPGEILNPPSFHYRLDDVLKAAS